MAREVSFWRDHLTGVPDALELPCDRRRGALQSAQGSRVELPLPANVAAAARELAGRSGVTLFMVLLAVYAELLHRYSVPDPGEQLCEGWIATEIEPQRERVDEAADHRLELG